MNYIFECVCVTHLSLDNNDADQIRADLPEKGFDFRACCSKIVPVDPVEWKLMKNGTECGSYATVSASRYPLLNYRGEVSLESTFAGIRMLNLKARTSLEHGGRRF